MTSVSAPTTGTLTKRRSRGFGPMVGAVALVLAAGAAIATGIAVNSGDTTAPAAQSIYLDDLERLLNTSPAQLEAASADAVHMGRVGGLSAPELSTYEGLVAAGIIPEAYDAAKDLSTYEGLVAAGVIPEVFNPATDLSTYDGLVAAGIIPPRFVPTAPETAATAITESPLFGSPETWWQSMFGNPELDHFRSINVIPEPQPKPFFDKPGQPR